MSTQSKRIKAHTMQLTVGLMSQVAIVLILSTGGPSALRAQPTPEQGCRVSVEWFEDGRTGPGIPIFGNWRGQKGGHNIPTTYIPDYGGGSGSWTPGVRDPYPAGARIISFSFNEDCTYNYDVRTPRGPWTSHSGRFTVSARGIGSDFRYTLILYPSEDTIRSTAAYSQTSMPKGFQSFDGDPRAFGLQRSTVYRTNAQLHTVGDPGPGFFLVDARLDMDDRSYESVLFEPDGPVPRTTNLTAEAINGPSESVPASRGALPSSGRSAGRTPIEGTKAPIEPSPSWRISTDKGAYSIRVADGNVHIVPNFNGPTAVEAKLPIKTSKKGKTEVLGEWRTSSERGFMQILDVKETQITAYMLKATPGAYGAVCTSRTAAFISNLGEAMNQRQPMCQRIEVKWVYE